MNNNSVNTCYNNICNVENFILGGTFTPVLLSKYLQQLSLLRKSFYTDLTQISATSDYTEYFLNEYKNYCNFNIKLLNSKKLPNAIYFKLLQEFTEDYHFIEPIDTNKLSYKLTLNTLSTLTSTLKNSTNPMKTYRLKGTNKLIRQFIGEYGTKSDACTLRQEN